MSHVNSAGRVGALLGLTDPAASSGDLANGGSTVTSSSVPDHVSSLPHPRHLAYRCIRAGLQELLSRTNSCLHAGRYSRLKSREQQQHPCWLGLPAPLWRPVDAQLTLCRLCRRWTACR